MPTISQLPQTSTVGAADLVPISQSGTTDATTVGNLLAGTQSAILVPTGSILGRASLGTGGPEAIGVGSGLALNTGTLAALGITGVTTTTTIAASDLVGISQGGADRSIAYSAFLDGMTIDVAQPAAPATDSDTLWVAQGTSTMLRQTLAAIWSWIATKIPAYKRPVVEISTDTVLDGTVHNGCILVCSQSITLSPAFVDMGSGFSCDVINLCSGTVTFATGITTSTGTATLAPGQWAALRCASYSGGNMIYAGISGGTPSAPGQVTGLAATAITTNGMTLTWGAPASGGIPASYTVQYRPSGTGSWTTANDAVSGLSYTLVGLGAATSYDFEVFGVNSGGAGATSTTITVTTASTAGTVSAITWNEPPSGSYASGSGTIAVSAQVTPATAAVQFGFSTSATAPPASWTAGNLVNTNLWGAYVPVPVSAGTWYAWCEGTDGSAPTVFATPFTVTGALSAPGQVGGLAASAITSNGATLTWDAPTTGGAPTSYTVQFRTSGTSDWTTATSTVSGLTWTMAGLTAATSYDFQVFGVNSGGAGPVSAIVTVSTAAAAGSVTAITWNVPPSGSYAAGSGTIAVNAHVTPATSAVQFGFSTSTTVPPAGWTEGSLVNTDLWGAYVPIPASAGTWYAWCEGIDGSAVTTYPTPFTVT